MQLDNDVDDRVQNAIIADLQIIKWLRLLRIHRTISLADADHPKTVFDGQAQALKFLKESGAKILVWGTVPDNENRPVPAELFISSAPDPTTRLPYGPYRLDSDAPLPPIILNQLASVLNLVVASESVRFLAGENPKIGDDLRPFITDVEKLIANTEDDPGWDSRTRADVETALAQALWAEADVSNSTSPLTQAVHVLDRVTKTYDPQRDWKRLADATELLGMARLALVRREIRYGALAPTADQGTTIRSAIADLNDAAMIQNQHGESAKRSALAAIGNALTDTAGLAAEEGAWDSVDDAVSAYPEFAGMAPQERKTNGLLWFLFNLTRSADVISARKGNIKIFKSSVTMYRYLLGIWTMKKYPSLSMIASGALVDTLLLSASLQSEREATVTLNEAAERSREIVHSKQIVGEKPTLRDSIRLGEALSELGTRNSGPTGTEQLKQAVRIFSDAVFPYTPEHASTDWFRMQGGMAFSLQSLGERERNPGMLCEALTRSIVAEHGLARASLPIGDLLNARIPADASMHALRTEFGDETAHECQVANEEFRQEFGPH